MSVACEYGRERGLLRDNPVRGVKRVKRPRDAAKANRPWTEEERRTVLAEVPYQLRVPVALAMFTGLRKGDVLSLTKSAIRDGQIWPEPPKRAKKSHSPFTLIWRTCLHLPRTTMRLQSQRRPIGTPWTESGFNSTFIKAIAKLSRSGRVGPGLTFHGLRHTVGTLLIEAGYDIDTVRRWLGQKTLAMAIHYSETADTSERMIGVMQKFDPLGSKRRT